MSEPADNLEGCAYESAPGAYVDARLITPNDLRLARKALCHMTHAFHTLRKPIEHLDLVAEAMRESGFWGTLAPELPAVIASQIDKLRDLIGATINIIKIDLCHPRRDALEEMNIILDEVEEQAKFIREGGLDNG